jgi:magnesium-transporting ATPase (P-type)
VFQDYNDTVIAVGLSHLPWNSRIFSTADLGVGVDVVSDSLKRAGLNQLGYNSLLPSEILFISAISAHTCAFRLRGVESIAYMPTILAHGRSSLEAATAAALFLLSGCLSFGFYTFFSVCSVSTTVHLPEVSGAFLSLQVILPLVGLPMTMSDPDKQYMARVPPKNDVSIVFGKKEGKTLFMLAILKALPSAFLPQILYLVSFGELMIQLEPELLETACKTGLESGDWTSVIRCDGISGYTGVARQSASTITLAVFLLCLVVSSAGFVHRTLPLRAEPPWRRNIMWVCAVMVAILIIALYLGLKLEDDSFFIFPWYFYIVACALPFLVLAWVEYLKRTEKAVLDRAEKLRRLQFETRLGMWSPK